METMLLILKNVLIGQFILYCVTMYLIGLGLWIFQYYDPIHKLRSVPWYDTLFFSILWIISPISMIFIIIMLSWDIWILHKMDNLR